MNEPLVSVLMPVYNHAAFVRAAVQSVLEQNYPAIELLILDDGSTDATFSILQELAPICEEKMVRFSLSRQANHGTSATLSALISQSQGKYILALASDDILLPNCISEQVAVLEANPDVVQTLPDNYFIAPDGSRLERERNKEDAYAPLHTRPHNFQTFAAFWQAEMPGHDFQGAEFHSYRNLLKKHNFLNGSLWRASAIKSFPIPTCRLSEDHFINMQLSKLGRVAFVDKPLFAYRIHEGQTVRNKKLTHQNEQNLFLEELKRVSLPGQEKWKKILQEEWFTPHCTRIGLRWCYVERRNSYVRSQRVLGLFGHEFILHDRYKFQIPTWWKGEIS